MFRSRSIGGFFLRLLCLYALLMVLWPVVKSGYTTAYRASANLLFGSFGSGGMVEFRPLSEEIKFKDTEVLLRHQREPNRAAWIRISSRYTCYVPTVTLIALVLATPISWSRRCWALLWGLIFVHVVAILFHITILLDKFSYDNPIHAVDLSPWAKTAVLYVKSTIWASVLLFHFVIPALIWILVTFRRSDWEWLHSTHINQNHAKSKVKPHDTK